MRFDKLIVKSQEAIAEAENIADKYNNKEIQQLHLLLSLILQTEGVVPQILNNMNINSISLQRRVESEIEKLPKVYGSGEIYLSPNLKKIFDIANGTALNMKRQSSNLRQTRDMFLPGLISGEIDVSGLDMLVRESA